MMVVFFFSFDKYQLMAQLLFIDKLDGMMIVRWIIWSVSSRGCNGGGCERIRRISYGQRQRMKLFC